LRRSRVVVIGGSLGGLTVACLLRDSGHDVDVYERSPNELEQRGAGIGFLRSSYRYLHDCAGVDLDSISVTTDRIVYLARDGSVQHQVDHRYRFSSWNTVYRGLLGAFGTDRYHLGRSAVSVDVGGERPVVHFEDGSATTSDLVVAADGIRSTVRAQLLPQVAPEYAGYVAWRGTVPEVELPSEIVEQIGDAITYHVYANSHILAYPIPSVDGEVTPGGRLINFVWYRNYLAGGDLDNLMTGRDGDIRSVSVPPGEIGSHHVDEMRATAAARLPSVLASIVLGVGDPFVQAVYDISVPRMRVGRVCLIGDAAFAVRPHAAAGTAKAAEDGWMLDQHLLAHDDVDAALDAWEVDQLALGRQLLERTRRVGRRSQVDSTWTPEDSDLIFGLYAPGDGDTPDVL
jgi:2,6-dihydroxypyridine 3-monooxygenase